MNTVNEWVLFNTMLFIPSWKEVSRGKPDYYKNNFVTKMPLCSCANKVRMYSENIFSFTDDTPTIIYITLQCYLYL